MALFRLSTGVMLIPVIILGLCVLNQATDTVPKGTTEPPAKQPTNLPTTSGPSTTTEDPKAQCSKYTNTTCKECVSNSRCYFCVKNGVCALYPYSKLMPVGECGSLGDMAWGVCWVNFEILIIVMSVIGFLLILSVCICCCCCCRKRQIGIFAKDQAKYEQQRQELKLRSDLRKTERQSRTDEIRRKYGLMKDDNPYQRFDA